MIPGKIKITVFKEKQMSTTNSTLAKLHINAFQILLEEKGYEVETSKSIYSLPSICRVDGVGVYIQFEKTFANEATNRFPDDSLKMKINWPSSSGYRTSTLKASTMNFDYDRVIEKIVEVVELEKKFQKERAERNNRREAAEKIAENIRTEHEIERWHGPASISGSGEEVKFTIMIPYKNRSQAYNLVREVHKQFPSLFEKKDA